MFDIDIISSSDNMRLDHALLMKLTVTVMTPTKPYHFVANLHSHSSSRSFFLDPKTFYKKLGKRVPRKHHELEILEPSIEVLREQPLHVHESDKSANLFICYPLAVRTAEAAMELFRVWCAGAALKWDFRIDLNTVYTEECGNDSEKFFQVLKSHYEITVSEVTLEC